MSRINEGQAASQAKRGSRRWRKITAWSLAAVAVVLIGLAVALKTLTYEPLEQAEAAMKSDNKVTVSKVSNGYRFEPAETEAMEPNVIFYPGGLVEPESYSLFARKLAESGHRVYMASMPLNLAMFGMNHADSFIGEHPDEKFVIGGHSLGGVFGARYAAKHPDAISGVYFLASYADDGGDLSGSDLSALQITGTKDGVLNRSAWEESKKNLPADTSFVSIDGGNHGQFGAYGMQKGDHAASITAEEQLEAVIIAMEEWLQHP